MSNNLFLHIFYFHQNNNYHYIYHIAYHQMILYNKKIFHFAPYIFVLFYLNNTNQCILYRFHFLIHNIFLFYYIYYLLYLNNILLYIFHKCHFLNLFFHNFEYPLNIMIYKFLFHYLNSHHPQLK